MPSRNVDLDKYRLRRFVERLIDMDEVETHAEAVPLTRLSTIIEGTDKAVLFKRAGPEQVEIVAKTAGSPRRLVAAFEVSGSSASLSCSIPRAAGRTIEGRGGSAG